MKKRVLFSVLSMVICLVVATCFVACGKKSEEEVPWDDLGGGKTGADVEGSNISVSQYLILPSETSEYTEPDTTANNYFEIDLGNILGDDINFSFNDGVLTILSSGVYSLSGTLNGSIAVNPATQNVRLILNNVTINCSGTEAILIGKDKGKQKTISLLGTNTINMQESVADAGIVAKNCKLVINGGGILNIYAKSSATACSGIKAKYCTINGSSIQINATKNGIKSDNNLNILNANLSVTALADGIKTDVEPETEAEATKYAGSLEYGYIYIKNSEMVVTAGSSSDYTSGNHGISANNCLFIDNGEKAIKVTTNGGAPTTVTERLSDQAHGKALRVSGVELGETEYKATFDDNYALVIVSGKFELNSCSDAIASKGNVIINGGDFAISCGDDGVHAEYITKINGGDIEISKSYEGIEGAVVEISGGNITIQALDDGINAANGDLHGFSFYILITGGNIYVNASGDGLDSNGTLKITGGTVIVDGPTSGGDASLDADTGILTNGGNVLAIGSKGMVETPSTNSTTPYVCITTSSIIAKGSKIEVLDSAGNSLISHTSAKQFQSLIVSLSVFSIGEKYTIKIGSNTYNVTLSSIGTSVGSGGQAGMGPGFHENPRW